MAAMTPEQLKGMIDEMVGKAVGSTLDERLTAFQAKQSQDIATMFTQKADKPKTPKGSLAGQAVMSIAGAMLSAKQGHFVTPAQWAEKNFGDDVVVKALSAGTGSEGGYIIPEVLSTEVIELLRPASVVRRMNPVIVAMNEGNLTIPKLTGGATAGYIGENSNVGKTQEAFGSVTARAKKLAALVPISNDLIRRRSPGADTIVRDDLVASLAQESDKAFLLYDGTSNRPKGLEQWAGGTATAVHAQGTPDLAKVTTDLGSLVLKLVGADVRMIRPGFIMSPRVWNYLMTVRDGNGNYAFRDEMLRGTLWGWPFAYSSLIPNANYPSGATNSFMIFADFADVVIAESTNLMIDVSTEAAYYDGANVVAAFSLDQTVLRAIVEHDLIMRHSESVATLDTITWGA